MAIFKYFTHEAHALALINRGEMLLRRLSHFRAIEADGVRGDPRDGVLVFAPEGGLVMSMEDGRTVTIEGGSFNSSVKHNDIFVYCSSNQLSPVLAEKFGSFCVEIPEPEVLVRRLKSRAHPSSQLDYEQLVCGMVDYRDHARVPGIDWALPERLVLIKPPAFVWQDEHRIAIGKRNTMNVENVGITIQTSYESTAAEPVSTPIVLRLNRIDDAVLHRF